MKHRDFYFLLLSFFIIYSCGKKKNIPVIYFHNAEEDTTWINEKLLKEVDNAYSGKSVSVTDSLIQYSLGFRKTIGAISENPIQKVVVSAWVNAENVDRLENALALVVAVNDPNDKNIFWESSSLKEQLIGKSGKWGFVRCEFKLPKDILPQDKFSSYIWNNSKTRTLVDDIQFEFLAE